MLKPLQKLMDQADQILGNTKTAAAASDEVSSLANTLEFATEIEAGFNVNSNEQFEKVAKAVNKIAAEAELEVMIKSEQFAETARKSGYTEDQINEALNKVAAKKIHKNLGNLSALGLLSPGSEDLNSLKKDKKKEVGGEVKRHPAAHSLGGSR